MERNLFPLPMNPPAAVQAARSLSTILAEIHLVHGETLAAVRTSVAKAYRLGQLLCEARAAAPPGGWVRFLETEVPFSRSQAYVFMQLAEGYDEFPNFGNSTMEEALCLLTQQDAPDEDDVPADYSESADPTDTATGTEGASKPAAKPKRGRPRGSRSGKTGGKSIPRPQHFFTLDTWRDLTLAERQAELVLPSTDRFNEQGDNLNIEWALWSWNPVTGCLHDCPYCYARDIANRFYAPKFAPAFWPARLRAPVNTSFPTEKAAEWMGHKNVFVCSMADLFGRWVPKEWIDAVLDVVRAAPQWNFLFLTKFPLRLAEFDFPENTWVGTTVDCQARVSNAEKAFRKVKAGVKWLSLEPLIEPLVFQDLAAFQWLVLGGASKSTQTPEWHPPSSWVLALEAEADRLGIPFYEKTNLRPERVRSYPGAPCISPVAPDELRYLPNQDH